MTTTTLLPVPADIRRFHDDCLVFLAYTVTPIRLTRTGATLSHMAQRLPGHLVDLPKLREGGVDAVFLSVGSDTVTVDMDPASYWATTPPTKLYCRPIFSGPTLIKRVLRGIDALHRLIDENQETVELALGADDVERIVAKGKMAAIIHLTRGAIDDDLAMLRTYHRLGVRAIQIAYDDGSPTWVDACHAPPAANGLSAFGRDVIQEMNRLGMLIDLAHASDQAYTAVIAASHKPVISSHSGARALCNVWRNLTDETMHQLAAKGGMVGAFFGAGYLDPNFLTAAAARSFRLDLLERNRALLARYADDPWELAVALRTPPPPDAGAQSNAPAKIIPPIAVLLDHIDYCIGIVGEENYGLGSDFGGIDDEGVKGLDEPSKLANLTAALLAHGYSRERTRKILGTNLLRLFREVVGS